MYSLYLSSPSPHFILQNANSTEKVTQELKIVIKMMKCTYLIKFFKIKCKIGTPNDSVSVFKCN